MSNISDKTKKESVKGFQSTSKISREDGIVVDGGYIVGGGRRGLTEELDSIVEKEAELLREHFGTDVTIRFNSDRRSGGAYLVDSKENSIGSNCSIGLGAKLINSKFKSMTTEEIIHLSHNELLELLEHPDMLCFDTVIDLEKTIHSVSRDSKHILSSSEYRDFNTLEDATEYLFSHVTGLKPEFLQQSKQEKPELNNLIESASSRVVEKKAAPDKNIAPER